MEEKKYYFTEREIEVLKRIVMGKSNIEIGKELYISYHTVKVHVASILRKLNVDNRLKASIKAVLEGIIWISEKHTILVAFMLKKIYI